MKKKYIASLAGVVLAAGLGFVGYKYSAFEEAAAAIAHGAGVGDEYREFSEALNGGAKDKTKRPAGKKEKVNAEKSGKKVARKLEMPAALKGVPETVIGHTGFTVSFNREHNNPNWVAWELTADETEGAETRELDFYPDPLIAEPHRVTTDDYKGSGYDRGHQCPAADMKWSREAMHDCFYMSNICPQEHALNSGGWQVLEGACRRWAKQEGHIYIICGPVYGRFGGASAVRGIAETGKKPEVSASRKPKKIGKDHIVTVPDGFFKCVLSVKSGEEKAIAFYYTNSKSSQTMSSAAVSVDDIELLTGMDFFVNLDKKTEKRVEATYNLSDWN